jgi:hypothetical protein
MMSTWENLLNSVTMKLALTEFEWSNVAEGLRLSQTQKTGSSLDSLSLSLSLSLLIYLLLLVSAKIRIK